MTHLLYHSINRSSSDISPFDDAVLSIARNGHIQIISPYIGVSYLERIVDTASDWSLISDVEAWLSSLSVRARPRAWGFIRENIERIHHCTGIHAKAVIGESRAMLGSANLTASGIQSRTELGILLDEPEQIIELRTWYEGLWSQTVPPCVNETSAFVEWLDDEIERSVSQRQKFVLAPETRKVRARLIRVESKNRPPPRPKLDLGIVAQEIVERDDRRYTSIGEAVERVLDVLAAKGFLLGQMVREVRKYAPEASFREVYFLLLQHCANHPRSVFVESTVSRLIVINGVFMQSEADGLRESLRAFDQYLVELIRAIRFDGPAELPAESDIERITGILERDQVILIGELIDADFLGLYDLPGELPQYELRDDFEWAGRFRLFPQAKHAWDAMRAKPKDFSSMPSLDDNNDDDSHVLSFVEEQRTLRRTRAEEAKKHKKRLEDEAIAFSAEKRALTANRFDFDEAQAKVLEWVLASPNEQQNIPIRKPGRAIAALGIPSNLVSRLFFSNPNGRVLEAIAGSDLYSRIVQYKPIDPDKLSQFPKTKEVLFRYRKISSDRPYEE